MLSTSIAQLLFFQTEASQAVTTDPHQSLNSWLVIAGIALIFACLLMVLIPRIKDLLTLPQELNLSRLGISMRISILTVFVIMGFVLSLSTFALDWRGYVRQASESAQKVAELTVKIEQLENRLKAEQKFDMSILVKPQLKSDQILNLSEWTCTYWLDESGNPSAPIRATIDRARSGQHLRIFLKDITPVTRVYRVELRKGNQSWTAEGLSPLKDGIWEAELQGGRS